MSPRPPTSYYLGRVTNWFIYPHCHCELPYRISKGKSRSSQCRHDFRSPRLPFYLIRDQWKAIITWFPLIQSPHTFANKTAIGRKRVLRALKCMRGVRARDVPNVFLGTVESIKPLARGHRKKNQVFFRDKGTERGGETEK